MPGLPGVRGRETDSSSDISRDKIDDKFSTDMRKYPAMIDEIA